MMTDENILIAQRIRAARLQRNLTQQVMADKFNKTSAAISDIERGKTQITASDLIIFADLLIKPIDYFYGEDFVDKDIEDFIAMIHRLPHEMRKQQIPMMSMMLKMTEINYNMKNTDEPIMQMEAAKEFYDSFLSYYEVMSKMMSQLNEAKSNLELVLGVTTQDLPSS